MSMRDSIREENFQTTISRDLYEIFVGDKISSGSARTVFAHRMDDSLVIKFETAAQSFQNVMEWEFWQDVQFIPAVAKWLAPCVSISPCGCVLIQQRVRPVRQDELPKQIPTFLTDTKVQNFGRFEKRIVACDYALTNMNPSTKLRKAKWWGES
jgi:hypothetical protein